MMLLFAEEKDGSRSVRQKAPTPVQQYLCHTPSPQKTYEFNVPERGISIRIQLGEGEPK